MNDKEKLILEDKNYFMKVIPEMISFCKLKKIPITNSKHTARHSDGSITVAYFNYKEGLVIQHNFVTSENSEGISTLKYKIVVDK